MARVATTQPTRRRRFPQNMRTTPNRSAAPRPSVPGGIHVELVTPPFTCGESSDRRERGSATDETARERAHLVTSISNGSMELSGIARIDPVSSLIVLLPLGRAAGVFEPLIDLDRLATFDA